jgi:hypothetical protein
MAIKDAHYSIIHLHIPAAHFRTYLAVRARISARWITHCFLRSWHECRRSNVECTPSVSYTTVLAAQWGETCRRCLI